MVDRARCLSDWVHGMEESKFRKLYKACLDVDPDYFLFSTVDEFKTYYEKNQFRLFHGALIPNRVEAVRERLN